MEERAREFASKARALVVAAAGCGKTELIAKAVASGPPERQLILTHTHAGVRALRDRLSKMRVPSSACRVETLDGFALRYAAAFPKTSGCTVTEPSQSCDWIAVREACRRALENRRVEHVFTQSYAGFYVDEYQDCTRSQHRLVLRLAQLRPCRVVGDPMQAVFGFEQDDPLPSWESEVATQFERLPDLTEPHRWLKDGANRDLGDWLARVRRDLSCASWSLSFTNGAPVNWVHRTGDDLNDQRGACFRLNKSCGKETVVAIHNHASQQHRVAKALGGCYQSIEEVEGKDLLKHCGFLGDSIGIERARRVVDAACQCVVRMPKQLQAVKVALAKGRIPTRGKVASDCAHLLAALQAVAAGHEYLPVADCLDLVSHMPGVALYRRELMTDMRKTCRLHDCASGDSLRQTAWKVRDAARRYGRHLYRRVVARTLLVKGLEFDHAVVLDADGIRNPKDLYVALTRSSRSLTIVSRSPTLAGSQ